MTIEERAEKYVHRTNLERDFGFGITPKEDYIKGATDQDPISRAEQKKIDIEKACDAFCKSQCGKVMYGCGVCGKYKVFKQAMEG